MYVLQVLSSVQHVAEVAVIGIKVSTFAYIISTYMLCNINILYTLYQYIHIYI